MLLRGPNLARNFASLPKCEPLRRGSDRERALSPGKFPKVLAVEIPEPCWSIPRLGGRLVARPRFASLPRHSKRSTPAARPGRKPLATAWPVTAVGCAARHAGGHARPHFRLNPAVRYVKTLIDSGDLAMCSSHSPRLNLVRIRSPTSMRYGTRSARYQHPVRLETTSDGRQRSGMNHQRGIDDVLVPDRHTRTGIATIHFICWTLRKSQDDRGLLEKDGVTTTWPTTDRDLRQGHRPKAVLGEALASPPTGPLQLSQRRHPLPQVNSWSAAARSPALRE